MPDRKSFSRPRVFWLLFPFLLIFTFSWRLAVLAQEAPPPAKIPGSTGPRLSDLIERVEVRVLLVDVFVTDKKGNPVTDLRQEDFQLLIDGDLVEVDSFESREIPQGPVLALETGSTPAEGPENVYSRGSGQKVILLFDSWNTSMADQVRVREQALDSLEKGLVPYAEVMILSLSDRLRLVQNFTSDRSKWIGALQGLAEDDSDLDGYLTLEPHRLGAIADHCSHGNCIMARSLALAYATEEKTRALRTVRTLQSLIFTLGALPGRKSIIYLSSGVPTTPGGAYLSAADCRSCGDTGNTRRINPVEFQVVTEFRDLYLDANAGNVTFHTIDARRSAIGSRQFLTNLAYQTGGTRGSASQEPKENLKILNRQMANYYVLGHTLISPEPDGRSHNIIVKLTRPGLEVRHRRKFSDLGWKEKDEWSVLGAMAIPEIHNDLPIEARILPFRKEKKRFDLFFELGLPLDDLFWLPMQLVRLGEVEFVGVITSSAGKIKYQFRDTMELKTGRQEASRRVGGVFYRGHTVLGPGKYELIAVVHDIGSGRVGSTRIAFEIPKPKENRFSLGGLVLAKISRGDLVMGAYSPYTESKKQLQRRYRKENVVPLIGEGLTSEDILLTYLQIYDPVRKRSEDPSWFTVKISFLRDGKVLATHRPVEVEEEEGRADSIPFAMLTPLKKFEPGSYDLRVEVKEKGTNRTLVREIPLRILDSDSLAKKPIEAAPQGL